ncbi:MAG: hypothetical protein ACLFV4_13435, partial [Candidatus Hydrogenedentota bacterium]
IEDWNTQTGEAEQKRERIGGEGGESSVGQTQEALTALAFHGTPPPDTPSMDMLGRLCDLLASHCEEAREATAMLQRQVMAFQRLYKRTRKSLGRGQPGPPEILRSLQGIQGVLVRAKHDLQGLERLRRALRELPKERLEGQMAEFSDLAEDPEGFHNFAGEETQLRPIQAVVDRLCRELETVPAETKGAMNELRQVVTGLKGDVTARMDRLEQNVEALRRTGQSQGPDPALQHIETGLAALNETVRELRDTVTQDRGAETAVGARIASLTEAFEDLEEYVRPLAAGHAQKEDELEDAEEEAHRRLDLVGASVGELAQQVHGVLKRMEALESRVAESPSKEFSERILRERDEALRDRQETREELARLGAELEELRRVNAELQAEEASESEEEDSAALMAQNLSEVVNESDKRLRIGEILVKAGVITDDQLDAALSEQAQMPYRRLGGILVANGYASDETIAYAVACQMGAPFLRLAEETIEAAAARLITGRLAAHHACIPIRADSKNLVLAMINPLDLIAIEDVELTTNRQVEPVVVTGSDLEEAIRRHYGVEVMI